MNMLERAVRPVLFGAFVLFFSVAYAQQPACTSVEISPTSATAAGSGGPASTPITISGGTPSGCRWTAVSNVPWITISFGSSGTTSGTTGYTVGANPSTNSRSGTITIVNRTFTVNQSGASCSYSVSPTTASVAAAGSSGTFTVIVPQGCAWTASTTSNWIRITSGAGNGTGAVSYTVERNDSPTQRFGSITVGNATFTITQAGFVCTYSVSPSSQSFSPAGGSGSFNLNTADSCSWQAESNAGWITVTSAASGKGATSVTFAVAASPEGASRSGTISIGTATFTVNQSAACVVALSPTSQIFPPSGGTGSISVTTSLSNCERPATTSVSWITITSGANATGSGQVNYSVAANNTNAPRTGTITIGGQAFTVTQQAAVCSITINPVSANMSTAGGSGRIDIVSSCTWSASVDVPWVLFTTATTGTGNGFVQFSVARNENAESRVATISLGDRVFTVYQAGTGQQPECRITLTPGSANLEAAGGSGQFQVAVSSECLTWRATSGAGWLNISGTTEAGVIYSVQPNRTEQDRTAAITVSAASRSDPNRIASQDFLVTQSRTLCTFAVNPRSAGFPASGGTGAIDITTECSWTAGSNRPWIVITAGAGGTGNGRVEYRVQENTSALARKDGIITAAGQQVAIWQAGAACTVTLSRTSAAVPSSGGSGDVGVTVTSGCEWTATTDAAWLTVTYASAGGSAKVYYTTLPNTTGAARTAQINVQGQMFTVSQSSGPYITQAGVVNAASIASTPMAPGLIATVFGSAMGPAQLVTLELTPDQSAITTLLAGTRVLFDGVPAPVIYTSAGQLSVVVPYSVKGRTTTRMAVEYQGVRSNDLLLPVAASAPAIFTIEQSGTGPGAVLNQDYKVNSAGNRARRNQVVMIFATGGGETDPPGEDGLLVPPAPLRRLQLPVSVTIGGQPAQVVYAGSAPTLVSGVVQINARIAANAQTGAAVPVAVTIGGVESPPGVTIAVQ